MFQDDPITCWIEQLNAGNERAADGLFQIFFEKLMVLARSHLGNLPRRAEDEEDAAQSALKSYFRGAAAGRFNGVRDRHDLWSLLARITARKVVARQRRFYAQKRPRPMDEAALETQWNSNGVLGLEQVIGRDLAPDFIAEFADDVRWRLQQLPDDEFRQIALLKLEGFTNLEIAERLGTYKRKVERRLEIIRSIWDRDEGQSTDSNP